MNPTQPQDDAAPTRARAPGALWTRLAARVVDAVLLTAIGVSLGLLMDFSVAWLVVQAGLIYAYFVLFDTTVGTTPGKRLFRLRVLGPDGGRPTLGQAAAREAFTLVGAVPYAGPVFALGAWIAIAVTIRASEVGEGLHDRLAGGTRVTQS